MSDSNEQSFSPAVFSRQLDQIEELHSSGANFDDTNSSSADSIDHGMEWRRQLLEESHTRIKQAKARTLDPKKIYELGTLLYDEEENKFGRVLHSQKNFLLVEFISGGSREYGKKPAGFDRDQIPDMQAQKSAQKRNSRRKSSATSPQTKAAATSSGKAKKSAAPRKGKAAGKSKDPDISDVNAYIKQNFKTMSNREMARHVGLSEHTIRRKLGEWGLKRTKR